MNPRVQGGFGTPEMSRTFMVSLLLHLLALSLLLLPPLPRPKLTFGPVYSVELVSLPAGAGEMAVPAETDTIGTAALGKALPSVAPLRKRVDTASLPLRPIVPPPKQTNPNIERVMEQIRQRATAVNVSARRPAELSAVGGATAARAAKAMNDYFALVTSRIRWAFPPALLMREDTQAIITVRISRAGTITNIAFEKRSGNKAFDESALMAVRKANPLPPLPPELGGDEIEVSIVFGPAGLR